MATPIATTKAYEEVIDFIAAGVNPNKLARFYPSETAKKRVAELLYREKTEGLAWDEEQELDHFMQLEHIMRLAKAKARQRITHE
jgi:hypothetical protein